MIAGIVAGYPVFGGGGPTWATWSPTDKTASIALTGGDLIATRNGSADATVQSVRATSSKSSGKHYFEIQVVNSSLSLFNIIGFAPSGLSLTSFPGATSNSWGYYQDTGEKFNNNTGSAYGAIYADGDVIGCAVDLDAGKIWWARNNTWQASGNPAAGTGEAFSGLSGAFFPMITLYRAPAQFVARFDPTDQTYGAPSGFTAGWSD